MEYKKIGDNYYVRMDRGDEDGKLFHHTHALFSFKEDGQHGMAGGHLKATTVLYTAEIELRPTVGGAIGRKFDPETGTGFWHFKD